MTNERGDGYRLANELEVQVGPGGFWGRASEPWEVFALSVEVLGGPWMLAREH